jgi:predicted helicase
LAKREKDERALFKLVSLGVVTNRDEWVYDESPALLSAKVSHLIDVYRSEQLRWNASKLRPKVNDFVSREIKWTSELEAHMVRGTELTFSSERVRQSMYRPFCRRWTYYSEVVTHRLYQQNSIFPVSGDWSNKVIVYTNPGSQKPFMVSSSSLLPDLCYVGAAAGTGCLAMYRYEGGKRLDNITDWALKQFSAHYKAGPGKRLPEPTKEGIFHYVYAVLHDPVYRETYAQNLKREFPRVPLHGSLRANFWQWAAWGQELMDLHIGYESAQPFAFTRTNTPDVKASTNAGEARYTPKCVLKSEPEQGRIVIDSETTLSGIPPEAWAYKLGNRSAIDWVLDQHKERKPKDPTIRARFDTYRFADHKEAVITLLSRVITVSTKTLQIVDAIRQEAR